MSASAAALDYDYLIVGGGAAGLSLAYHMAQEPRLATKKVLLIEPEAKDRNDRTWSFWTDKPMLFDSIVAREWQRLAFRSPGFEQVFDLGRYRYKTIKGLDYYRFVRQALVNKPGFTLLSGAVHGLEHRGEGVLVRSSIGSFTASFAFDSRPPDIRPQPGKYRYQVQHFVGWEVETEGDAFDPEVVEFMDFRGEQGQEARFMYVLPFGKRRALVEYTLFSGSSLAKAEYETAIRHYLTQRLGAMPYRVLDEETGAIPMTDHPLPARAGARILNLGTRAGRAKPSTGYAFKRIQEHSVRLVEALASTGRPPDDATGDKWPFRLFDTLLLDIMQRRGESTRDIFRQLFARNPIARIFCFLDEQTSWVDNFRIMNSVQAGPFLRSIVQVLRGKPGQRSKSS